MDKSLLKIEKYLFWIIVFVFPIIVLPIFPNYVSTAKLTVLSFGVGLILLVKAARILTEQKLDIASGNFDFPVLLLLSAYIASAIIRTPNKMNAFLMPGTATLMISSILFYFLLNQNREAKKTIAIPFLLSGIVVSIFSALSMSGLMARIPGAPSFLADKSFTLLGGNLPVFLYLLFLTPAGLGLVVNEEKILKKVGYLISLAIVTIGAAANLYNILPGKPNFPKSPGLAISWEIAVDALKSSPLLGIGPANFQEAFDRFRPITYNQTDNWNLRFSSASNFYLTALTEVGLLGLSALILLAIVIYRTIQKDINEKKLVDWGIAADPDMITLITLAILLAVYGSEFVLVLPFFSFLAVAAKTNKITLNFQAQSGEGTQKFASALPSFLVSLPIILATLAFGFFATRALMAEATFKKSLDAVAQNNGGDAYNLMIKAINQNPRVDRYHASLSQIEFAIANNISQKPEGQNLTDEEKNTVTQLIQQSIAEGKAAVSLNPTSSQNWTLLASLYRSVMAFAQGSDQFAIQSYNQAIALNPIDTNLRVSLGGVYFALGDYDNAIDALKLAVLTKPDFANARYNLAVAYREKGEINKAIAEMTNVLSLVDKDSQDWQTAKKELDALEAKKPAEKGSTTPTTQATPESLTTPAPAETAAPQIKLPEEAAPEISPTPEPSPTASPAGTG
jgi:tetratricopeptide (TPR) repeat protein